jgi:hypothetical protein
VDSNKKTVVHNIDFVQKLGVSPQLLRQKCSLLRSKLQHLASIYPIEIFEHSPWVLDGFILRVFTPHSATLQVVSFVDIPVRREQVVHDNEVNLASPREFYTMKPVESREQCVRVILYVRMILLEYG